MQTMKMFIASIILYLLTFTVAGIDCGITLKVIPESVHVKEVNNKYVKWANLTIRRYERRGDYYFNICAYIYHTWTNNVSIDIVLTEFLHNEYRPSFITLNYMFCDFINKEPFIGGMIKKVGFKCPTPAGEYKLMNMSVQSATNVFPFTKGGANVHFKITDTSETIAKVEYHVKFQQKKT